MEPEGAAFFHVAAAEWCHAVTMKKTNEEIVEQIRQYAQEHPEESYLEIAVGFGLSEITIKRLCRGVVNCLHASFFRCLTLPLSFFPLDQISSGRWGWNRLSRRGNRICQCAQDDGNNSVQNAERPSHRGRELCGSHPVKKAKSK